MNASKLMGDTKVLLRVEEIRERITNTGIASAERVLIVASIESGLT